MSKSDSPPAYNACNPAIYNPQMGYPTEPPPYTPTATEDQGYPAPPYSGTIPSEPKPQLAAPASASGLPHMMPTTAPPVMPIPSCPSTGDAESFAGAGVWDGTTVRHAFIQKVYLILASQLLVTVSIVAVFTFVEPVRVFIIRNSWLYWASYAVYFVCYIVLVCFEKAGRLFPWNMVFLAILTFAMSYLTGAIASYYDTKAVFLALGVTVVVCVAVTVFCFQTKVDFTACAGLLSVLGIVFAVTGIITAIVLSFQYIEWLEMLYAAIGTVIFTMFLAFHTQLLIGNRKLAISPEEYVYAALSIYLNVIQIFLFLLQIIGGSSSD